MSKNAIIFGVTGQDGSYLSEYLLSEGYKVIGVKRRSSTNTEERLCSVSNNENFHILTGDITDYASVSGIFSASKSIFGSSPREVYNLAAQSHVAESFKQPLSTFDIDACGVVNILEVIRREYIDTKFYQASTSEMFGDNFKLQSKSTHTLNSGIIQTEMIQDESVAFSPRSPYAVAKVAAHNMVKLYRDAYGIFGCCGILFNHESPRRGEDFVTRKISLYVARLYKALKDEKKIEKLKLGNLEAKRDWGHAKDYVKAMNMMMCHNKPDDYIVATGESHSVREFCNAAFSAIGQNYKDWVEVDENFIRPAEVPHLQGIRNKITEILGWEPETLFKDLVKEMVEKDIEALIE